MDMGSKLYYYYGAMASSKSASLLMNVYNYEQQGKRVVLLKPSFDTRSKEGQVQSRIGISHSAIEFTKDDDLYHIISDNLYKLNHIDCVFIDEVQFATREQIKQLVKVVDGLGINVIAYGLKNSYVDGVIFDSVQELMYQCNAMYEIKSTCQWCNSKATHHIRLVNGVPVRNGEENIVGDIDGDEKYISTCRYHYYNCKEDK